LHICHNIFGTKSMGQKKKKAKAMKRTSIS
jgi:hypothetical protein